MSGREALSVSAVAERISKCLEKSFPAVLVRGEVSEFVRHPSGHWYFTLKDDKAQLRAVMFKFQNRLLRFQPEPGMEVVCRGRIRAYAPRSLYQLGVEWIEPLGIGALHLQFEQLKARLAREGLFAPERKRPIPSPLRRLAIITSLSGAALQDMLRVLRDRDPAIEVLIAPAPVQGADAAAALAAALDLVNRPEVAAPPDRRPLAAVIIGRGGGSIEDLWAFNEEVLARAIFRSALPVISAVGHEIDFTISDFVADLRAATPTAAAEFVAAGRGERRQQLVHLEGRLAAAASHRLESARSALGNAALRLHDPRRAVLEQMLRLDELSDRSRRALENRLHFYDHRLALGRQALTARNPRTYYPLQQVKLENLGSRLRAAAAAEVTGRSRRLDTLAASLAALSPAATLARGFAIARDRQGRLVREAGTMAVGDELELTLWKGRLGARVSDVKPEDLA